MTVSWLVRKRDQDVNVLIARRQYDRAIPLVRQALRTDGENVYLRQALADVLVLAGRIEEAVPILHRLADDFAAAGFVAKAIAVFKKIDRVAPARSEVYEKLADLIPKKQQDDETLRRRRGAYRNGLVELEKPAPIQQPEFTPAAIPVARGQATDDGFELEMVMEEDSGEVDDGISVEPKPLTLPLFQSLPQEELVPFMKSFRLVSYLPGDVIVTEGERDASFFILTTGRVKVWVSNESGHLNKVRELTDGEFFGEISLLTGLPRTATITAASRSELLLLDKATADALCERFPNVRDVLKSFVENRLHSQIEMNARTAKEDR